MWDLKGLNYIILHEFLVFGVKTFVITGVLISHSEKKLVLSVPLYINDFSQLEGRRDNLLHSCRMTFWFLSEGIVSHFLAISCKEINCGSVENFNENLWGILENKHILDL